MLHYPKIPGGAAAQLGPCIAFEKLDGTNVHFEWHRDFGWHSFGTRRDSFNLDEMGIQAFTAKHEHLRECANIFYVSLAAILEHVFLRNENYREASSFKIFAEFFGPNSFAGLHVADDPKELRLFDVEVADVGIVPPAQFVADFGSLPIAPVVFQGKFTGKFADDVRNGKFKVNEGVVCKGGNYASSLWMAKIKTNVYRERLKKAFAENWEEFWE